MPQEPLDPGDAEPIHIVPATTPPEPVAVYEPTQVIPQVPYQAPIAPVVQPAPVVAGPMYYEPRRPAWPYVAAVLALVIGGVIGFLIGNSRHPDTSLTSTTQPLDSTVGSLAPDASVADLQNQVALLTAAQTKAAQDLADAQAALTQTQAERDALAAQVGTAGSSATGLQADLDATKAQVTKLQGDLKVATTQLDTANASLQTAQAQLDTANATLTALHPTPLANYVNGNVTKVRADAQANGWTVIEEAGTSPTAAVGTVLEQTPAPNTNMVTGSVILVKVKQ